MRDANQILGESFLEVRAKLLEVAATLDRIDQAVKDNSSESASPLPQRVLIDKAIRICLSEGPARAERLQKLCSREYESDWRKQMDV